MKRFLLACLTVFVVCVSMAPTTLAVEFDAVPDNNEGYVPDTAPEEEGEHEFEYDPPGFSFIMKIVASLIYGFTALFEWAVSNTSLQAVIFGDVNPLNGEAFGANAVGNIFSAAEWNYAVNPLRIAFTFAGWIFFAVMIAYYGIKLMKESTNPIQRTQLLENVYAWIGGAAMLAFMYIVVFIIFNINTAIVGGLHNLVKDSDSFGEVFGAFLDTWRGEEVTGGPIGDALLHFALVIMSFVLIIQYIFRKFIIGLLVVISPLAAVAFARNKDGTAFKTWLSELFTQVFMQSAHAIVIVLFFALLNASTNGDSILSDNLEGVGNNVQAVVDPILSFLIAIGGVIAIGALTYNGLRLSMSGGNPNTRVHAIKGIRTSLIGLAICVGSVIIVSLLRGLMF